MGTRAPVRMAAEERREQLLDVTKAIVVERGFHAVSIEGVARDAGISRPIVYGHFDDLPGLLDALVKREGARALGQLAAVLPPALARSGPEERLVAALDAYLEAVQADPGTWRLVLVPSEGAPAVLHEAIARGRAAVVAQLAAALGGGERGLDAPPDPELAAHLLSALADEAARLLLAEPERYPRERVLALARWFLGVVPPV
jgi:AcrR family transcriptional regulator